MILLKRGALTENRHGAVSVVLLPVELLEPGEVLEPILPLFVGEFFAEPVSAAGLSEPFAPVDGEVTPPAVFPATSLPGLAGSFAGLAALFGAMFMVEPLAVEPFELPAESWADTDGANAATDNAKPAPKK